MKRLNVVLQFLLFASLTGCQSPARDMMNNNFVAISPKAVPANLVGTWTGSMGPYLVSMKWQADGYGLFCYSYGTADVLQRVKFVDGEIFIQDGTKLQLKGLSTASMIVHTSYFSGKDSTLLGDRELRNASVYCAKALST